MSCFFSMVLLNLYLILIKEEEVLTCSWKKDTLLLGG